MKHRSYSLFSPIQKVKQQSLWFFMFYLLSFSCLFLSTCFFSTASAEKAPPKEEVQDKKPHLTIALPEVVRRSELTLKMVRSLIDTPLTPPLVRIIEETLPAQEDSLYKSAASAAAIIQTIPSHHQLIHLEREWLNYIKDFTQQSKLITDHMGSLHTEIENLKERQRLWQQTKESTEDLVIPEIIRQRIQKTIDELKKAEQSLMDERRTLLTIQDQVTRIETIASEVLARIYEEQEELQLRIFKLPRATLWESLSAQEEEFFASFNVSESIKRLMEDTKLYIKGNPHYFIIHGLISVVVFLYLLALRRFTRTWEHDDPRFPASSAIVSRPLASTFMFALFLTELFHIYAPLYVLSLLSLIIGFFPILWLMPKLFSGYLRRIPYIIALFYILDRFRDLIDPLTLLERLIYTIETALAAAVIILFLYPTKRRKLPFKKPWAGVFSVGLSIVAFGFLISSLATLFGYVDFGFILGESFFTGFDKALVVYGTFCIVQIMILPYFHTKTAQALRLVQIHHALLQKRISQILTVLALTSWFYLTFNSIGIYKKVTQSFIALLTTSYTIGSISLSLSNLLTFPLTVFAAYGISHFIRFFLAEDVFPRLHLRQGVSYAITTMLHYFILFVGFLIAMAAAGVDFNRFTLLAGAFGVGLGLGLQSIVNNFVSGLVLLFERPVQTEDIIRAGEHFGIVKHIGIRSSLIRSFQGADIIIPNSIIVSDEIVNYSHSDQFRRIEILAKAAYGTDPKRVITLLKETALNQKDIDVIRETSGPYAPYALFLGYGESSLDFELRLWTQKLDSYSTIKSNMTIAVNSALIEAGIKIPYPKRDVHLKSSKVDDL